MQLRPVTHTARVSQISIFSLISPFNATIAFLSGSSVALKRLNFVSSHCRWVTALARHLGEAIRIFYVIQDFDIGLIGDWDLSQFSHRAGPTCEQHSDSIHDLLSVQQIKQVISSVM
jgi:hypothetical protein